MFKFEEKDKVKHIYTHAEGIVEKVYEDGQVFVKFFSNEWLPCKLPANEYELVAREGEICPKCYGRWTKTQLLTSFVYDCFKCGIKKEDLNGNEQTNQSTNK